MEAALPFPAPALLGFATCRSREKPLSGDDDTWACMGFGMIVEQRSWKSAFALVS
jgi:hypothetical protein